MSMVISLDNKTTLEYLNDRDMQIIMKPDLCIQTENEPWSHELIPTKRSPDLWYNAILP